MTKEEILIDALEEIAGLDGMTLLSACCVDKFCSAIYDEDGKKIGACAAQYGVWKGYGNAAGIAKRALAQIEDTREGKHG